MNPRNLVTIILVMLVMLAGCVSQKKYDEMVAAKVDLETELAAAQDSLATTQSQLNALEKRIAELKNDTSNLNQSIAAKREELKNLESDKEQLQTLYDNLLSNSSKMNRDLVAQQEKLLLMEENLAQQKSKNDQLSSDLAQREEKVKELENVLAKKDAAVQELKNKIAKALLSFEENDLSVDIKNGKVYVSLAEQLLFKSGSTVVDSKGKSALQQLAGAIKDQKDINIMVEGHTDDVPISRTSQYMKDNWDLSVLRATSIIRILTEAGVSTNQISASGRGEYSPVASNEDAAGRQKNRRTEIIIAPNLDEVFKILETN